MNCFVNKARSGHLTISYYWQSKG